MQKTTFSMYYTIIFLWFSHLNFADKLTLRVCSQFQQHINGAELYDGTVFPQKTEATDLAEVPVNNEVI